MMEVKHSPSSQMDFRTATNGLSNEEDEEMNALLDNSKVVKSLPASSCDSAAKQNGTKLISSLDDGIDIDLLDDEMDEELNKTASSTENQKENEETEKESKTEKVANIDLFDLDLESAAVETEKQSVTNGDMVDASNVRDTGDDLDTLLSKINDLVEDCMEPSTKIHTQKDVVAVEEELLDENKTVDGETKDDDEADKVEELQETILDDTEVTVNDEDFVEDEEIETAEVAEKNDADSQSASDLKDAGDEELEAGDDLADDLLEAKSNGALSEVASDENGPEVSENDLEMAVDEGPEEIQEYIPAESEEIQEEEEEEEEEEEVDAENEAEAEKELDDDEIPPADTDTVEGEIIAEEIVEEIVTEVTETVPQEDEKLTKETATESMDVDDDIVCLDSPPPTEVNKEEEKPILSEKLDENSTTQVKEDKEEQDETKNEGNAAETEVPSKENIPATKDADASAKEVEADDEIFLIEDDDEPTNKTDSEEKPEKKTEESDEVSKKEEKLLEEEDPKPEGEEETQEKSQLASEEKPVAAKDIDEDDVVCLDDSFEESEENKLAEEPTNVQSEKQNDADASVAFIADESLVEKKAEEERNETETSSEKDIIPEKEPVIEAEETATKVGEALKDTSNEKSEGQSGSVEQVISPVVEKTTAQAPDVISKDSDSEKTKSDEISSQAAAPPPSSSVICEDDVITLDDDDEDEPAAPTAEKKKDEQPATAEAPSRLLELLSDNSDNARDVVEEKHDKNEPKESADKQIPLPSSEVNSNSSSSNLLKETTATAIEQEESRSEQCEQPPAKRIRLSQDEACSRTSNASREEDTNSKSAVVDNDDDVMILDNDDEGNKTMKRVHSSTELTAPDVKKSKTEIESSTTMSSLSTASTATETKNIENEKASELLEEIVPAKVEPVKVEEDKKPDEVKPLPLYPPPNFDTPKIGLSLDFLRRFKKSIHKMTKSDLEELVLQKIVETIVHKSEFSEMRELIEKQEKIISGHRTKITELNKQFRDLEMVHNRVLKDLETKNSQFIMPVKITRAVGLQVFFPNKKYDQPMGSLPTTPSSGALPRSVSTSSSTSSIPEKATTSSSALLATMMNQPSQGGPSSAPSSANPQPPQRRGCVQKLTPMRPDGPRAPIPPNRGSVTPGVVSSSTPSPITPKDISPKLLNRQIAPKSRPTNALSLNSPGLPQGHNVYTTNANVDPARTPMMPQGIATKKTGGTLKTFPPSKRIPKSWQSEQPGSAQPLPTTPTASSPMVPPVSPMVNSPTVAKTPNRSVIDLTDEDDMTPASSPRTPISVPAQKAAPGGQRVGPYKVSVIPAAQLQQQPRPNQPKNLPTRPQHPPQMVPKPNGTPANAVRRTPPPLNTQRYRHPAPLPNQPIHSSNPLWKLPPARPTIRISNLDSGIVISWTIEDMAKEKYAESTSYQIYAYQETSGPPLVESWRHVGDVKAMLLPMAVTLTQFQEGQRYYFAVRAVDAHNRCGPFSFAKTWS